MDCNTIRILSLDGGGMRGYLSLKFLQRFVQKWGINSNELWKYFDVIAGTSIGGIQALAFAFGLDLDTMETFFVEKGKRIFTIRHIPIGCDADSDSNRPNLAQKLAMVATNDPFYLSACPIGQGDSNYGTNILQNVLVDNFGTNTLQNLKTKVVIPAYEKDTSTYVLFSNYPDPYFIGQTEQIVNVARATSAAPVYLPTYSFNGRFYSDGGIYQNNPAEIALNIGKTIKPRANRYCVLSLGTGIGEMGFANDPTMLRTTNMTTNFGSSVDDIFSLFGISSTGGQESSDFNLKFRSKRTLEQLHYYRFQLKLDPNVNTELDNSDASFLTYLSDSANQYFSNDINNITTFLGHLTA